MREKRKDPHAVELGRRGGKKRAQVLSKERKQEIARIANKASQKARKKRTRVAVSENHANSQKMA